MRYLAIVYIANRYIRIWRYDREDRQIRKKASGRRNRRPKSISGSSIARPDLSERDTRFPAGLEGQQSQLLAYSQKSRREPGLSEDPLRGRILMRRENMRRLLAGLVVTMATALVPCVAMAGNQEDAEQIAKNLRVSGQMHDYKIGVKYQDGTATLRGQVSSEEQMKTAVALASKMQGVTRVVNNLTINASEMTTTSTLHQPDSLSRLQAAVKTEPAAKPQPAPRPNAVSNATFVSSGAPVATRPVAATEEQAAPDGRRPHAGRPTRSR